jgi:hypothetical protein
MRNLPFRVNATKLARRRNLMPSSSPLQEKFKAGLLCLQIFLPAILLAKIFASDSIGDAQ